MEKNIFVTSSKVPPVRWREAFPSADVLPILPADVPSGSIVWLHNLTPAQLPAGKRPAGVRFIVMDDEPGDDDGLRALSQGASGYCNAHAAPELLITIESVVRQHGLWVGESLLGRMLANINMRIPQPGIRDGNPKLDSLSSREREIALRVVRGESNKEIARQLALAERTIKAHLSSVFEKLGVRDRLQLAILLSTGK